MKKKTLKSPENKHELINITTKYFRDKRPYVKAVWCEDCGKNYPGIKRQLQRRWDEFGKSPVVFFDNEIEWEQESVLYSKSKLKRSL